MIDPSILGMAKPDYLRLLAEASTAWRQLCAAEANIRRLNGYRQLTRPMRKDAMQSAIDASKARETLHRVLGAKP